MNIKLLANQVPSLWQTIKYAAIQSDRVGEETREKYLTSLLNDLLSDRSQCFVRVDNTTRELEALAITSFIADEMTGKKSLAIKCLYSFKSAQSDEWAKGLDIIKKYAKLSGCDRVITYSNHSSIFNLVTDIGFKERYRCYAIDLEN